MKHLDDTYEIVLARHMHVHFCQVPLSYDVVYHVLRSNQRLRYRH